MDRDEIEKMMTIHSACADIQRLVLAQTVSGRNDISRDRRSDIVRAAQTIIRFAQELN